MRAGGEAGAFYGTRTILQALRATPRALPKGTARDWPSLPERGQMLDTGRTYCPLSSLRGQIRQMGWLKRPVPALAQRPHGEPAAADHHRHRRPRPGVGLPYLPRQDGGGNGRAKAYRLYLSLYLSLDGRHWGAPAAEGELPDTIVETTAPVRPVLARYVRLRILSEHGADNTHASLGELGLFR